MLLQETKIVSIAEQKGVLAAFPAEHLLFSVENGVGKLRPVWYDDGAKNASPYDIRSDSALMLGDTPLVQIQSDGCPTCASLLAAGYGLPEDSREVQQMREVMTQPYAGLPDALKRLQALLSLLQSGVYILTLSSLCPTDGEGRFFWDVLGAFTAYQATAQYYDDEMFRTLPDFPCFLYPTQGAHKYDNGRVEHYRDMIRAGQPIPPVLTYSLEASMCLLLDGHHRACACALEGVRVPALTITRPCCIWRKGIPSITWPDESETALAELVSPCLEKLLDAPIGERQHKQYPFSENPTCFRREWEPDYAKMAIRYPTCYDAGVLGLHPEVALTVEGICKLAMDDDYEEVTVAAHLLRYAARQSGADKKGLAMEFTQLGYPTELRKAAFEVLDSVKDDTEIDDLMVGILVNHESKDDPIYQIANGHWDAED